MAACELCKKLDGQLSKAEPHPRLKMLGSNKHRSMGLARGVVEHYKCLDCGTKLSRDCDSQDSHAPWWITKEG